jgi:hypothetical protein
MVAVGWIIPIRTAKLAQAAAAWLGRGQEGPASGRLGK